MNSLILFIDSVALRGGSFGSGAGDIFLDNLECSGTEPSLLDCDANLIGQPDNCDHSEDAGVRCEGALLT